MIDRALTLFRAVAEDDGSSPLAAIAAGLGIPLSSAQRWMRAFERQGLLVQADRGRRVPGLDLLRMTGATSAHDVIGAAARPLLRRYARRHRTTVHLGVWDGEMVTYLIKETRGEAVFTREGMTLEGYGSAIGKVLLAHLSADEQERFLAGGPFVALTSCTIVDPSVLREQLARVARQGFAVDAHEVAERLLCCAVPIRDRSGRVHAALSQSIVHHRAGGFDPATVAEQLAALSSRVSERLFV